MPMRITTSMTMNTYRYNLMQSNNSVVSSTNKVMTKRNFNSYAEDPAAATHAWRIRRAFSKNNAYITNNSDTFSRFSIAYAAMDKIKTDLANNEGLKDAVLGNSDTLASGRQALGSVVYNGAEAVIQGLNGAKYGDHFVFAGRDGLNVPFSWSEDGSTLYYRGVNVDAGGVKIPQADELDGMKQALDVDAATAPQRPSRYEADGTTLKPETQYEAEIAQYEKDLDAWNTSNAWKDYYAHRTAKAPAGEPPQDLTDDLQAALDKVQNDPNATDEDKRVAQEWYDYYTHAKDEKPTATEPDWLKKAEKDQYGYPSPDAIADRKAELNDKLANATTDEEKAEIEAEMAMDEKWVAYYKDQGDLARLEEMAAEETNVDLGMGLQEDEDGNIINGSVFNMALPGIKMIGYGVDEDGDPRNLATLMKKYAAVLERADPDTGQWTGADREEADRLLNKINAINDNVIKSYSDDVAASAQFLQTNGERLKEQGYTLNEERGAIEDIDPAAAISQFLYDYTCYNAALKVGTQLLSQSLIDYMN